MRPSDDRYDGASFEVLFTTGPRFSGTDQLSNTRLAGGCPEIGSAERARAI